MRAHRPFALAAALILAAAACGGDGDDDSQATGDTTAPASEDRPLVVATTTILGDITENVVGDLADVEVIMPPGSDPHDFEPSAQQAAELREADLIVANGLYLEEGLLDPLEQAEAEGIPVVEVAPEVNPIGWDEPDHDHGHDDDDHAHDDDDHAHDDDDHGHDDDHAHDDDDHGHDDDHAHDDDDHGHDEDDHGHDDGHDHHHHGDEDPHFWMDPTRVALAAEVIADGIAENSDIDPDLLAEQADAYAAELAGLDEALEELFDDIPEEDRKLVTNHDAFGYLADRYGFEVIGTVVPAGTTLAEPSAAALAELAEVIETEGVPAIFTETISPTELAETLAAETGVDVEIVELFSDSLGEPGSEGDTYVSMMTINAERMVEALT